MERIDKEKENYTVKSSNSKSVIGILLIGAGILVILRTMGLLPPIAKEVFFSWQMILIVIGTVIIVNKEKSKGPGFLLIGIGLIFLVPELVYIPYEFRRLSWGMILVLIGLFFIFRNRSGSSNHSGMRFSKETQSNDFIDDVSIFGGGDKVIYTESFKGGEVVAIFGGATIDLSKSELAPGTSIVECINIFGGTKFIIPAHWNVKVEVTSILGGFSDERRNFSTENRDNSRLLIIKGVAIFGGGEIKSF